MKKVYLLVECDVNDYPEVEQAKAADGAKDRVEAALINDCDRLSGPTEDTPWFDFGNGGMTVKQVRIVSNLAVQRIESEEDSKARLDRAQKEFEEGVAKYKKILEEGI